MNLLTSMGLLPLIGAGLIALLPATNAKLVKQSALLVSVLVAALGITMTIGFDRGVTGFQYVERYSWIPSLGISYQLGIDGISLILILLSVLLVPIVILAGWNESEGGRFSVKTFYILILVLETMMIGVFAATDLFLFYVFFEAMLVPVYFLIGGYGSGARQAAAVKFLLYSLFGGLLMLASIIGIFVISGNQIGRTFDITALSTLEIDATTQNFLFLGFFIAFAIKAPLWPLHTWLPDAAKSATPGTSVLLLGAIGQKDIKSLIAFTSISHFGFITLGIFAMTTQSNSGATLYMFNHGISTAALFLTAGWMISRRGSSTIADFGGLQRVTPILAWSFFIAGLSSLALPGLSSFVSEFLVLVGTYTRYPVAAVIATFGIILAALYILIPVQKALHGPTTAGNENLPDLNRREIAAIAPVIALIVALGFYPKPALEIINPSAQVTITKAGYSDPQPLVGGDK